MPIDKEKIAALVNRINSMPDNGEEFKRRYLSERGVEEVERGRLSSIPVRVPAMWGNASTAAVSSKDIPMVDSTVGNELRYAAAVTAPLWAGYAPGVMGVLANPANAATKAGAMTSTALDAYGVAGGLSGLAYDAGKAVSGDFKTYDIPRTLIDMSVLVPGASQFTTARNIGLLDDAVRNFANIRNITSKETLLNRLAHPLETYRFADLTRRAGRVLPGDVYEQLAKDIRETPFYNGFPGYGYNLFNKDAFKKEMAYLGGVDKATGRYHKGVIVGLIDPTARNDFSRAHELGHVVDVSRHKLGYGIDNYVPPEYVYSGKTISTAPNPERIREEYFADTFANKITGDMLLDQIDEVRNLRYPVINNKDIILFPPKTRKK